MYRNLVIVVHPAAQKPPELFAELNERTPEEGATFSTRRVIRLLSAADGVRLVTTEVGYIGRRPARSNRAPVGRERASERGIEGTGGQEAC